METEIKRLLQKEGRTINQLTGIIKRNRVQIYEVCNGFRRAPLPLQKLIAEALSVEEAQIFDTYGMARRVEE